MYPSTSMMHNMRNVRPTIKLTGSGADNTNGTSYTISRTLTDPPGPTQAFIMTGAGDDADAAEFTAMTANGESVSQLVSNTSRSTVGIGIMKPPAGVGTGSFNLVLTVPGGIDQCRSYNLQIDGIQDASKFQGWELQEETGADGELEFTNFHGTPDRFDGSNVTIAAALNSQTNGSIFAATSGIGGTLSTTFTKAYDNGQNDDTDGDSNAGIAWVRWENLTTSTALEASVHGTASPQRHRAIVANIL